MKKRLFLEAVATLTGTVIGAGVLGIPSVVARSGFLTGIVDIVLIGLAFLVVNLYMGEVVLRTNGNHQLSGYAEKYLGVWGKRMMCASMVLGIYGALTAYLIGEGEALKALLGGNELIYSLIFFVIVSAIVFLGLDAVEKSELFVVSLLVIVVVAVFLFGFRLINTANLAEFDAYRLFVPYGVVLFAFLGTTAIPEMNEELVKNRRAMKNAIVVGSLIPIAVYLLFALVVVGIIGDGFSELGANQQVATVALSFFVGEKMAVFANLFAVFAMMTSFIALGYALKEMFKYDYRISKNIAWILTCIVPLAFFLTNSVANLASFISVLAFTGAVSGGIAGILIVLMHYRAKKLGERKPEYAINEKGLVSVMLAIMFILGIVYEAGYLSGFFSP